MYWLFLNAIIETVHGKVIHCKHIDRCYYYEKEGQILIKRTWLFQRTLVSGD